MTEDAKASSKSGNKSFLQRLIVTTIAVFLAEKIVDGVDAIGIEGLLAASLLLGLFNAFLRPIMMILSLPLLFFTLGLFTFVINAALLSLVGFLLSPNYFVVTGFWPAFKATLVISIVSLFANLLIGRKEMKVRVQTNRSGPPPPTPPRADIGSGPVIDV